MPQRTIILFSAFIILAVVGGAFIFYYRDYANQLVQDYIAKITICGNISDENICYQKDFCEGIYGSVTPGASQIEFKRCQRIPLQTFIDNEKQQTLCVNTGGEWYRNKLGSFCLCQSVGINTKFDKATGCVAK